MLSNGILDIEDTEGEEISLTAEGPQLTEEERLRIESEKEEGDDEDVKRIDLFSEQDEDPLNNLLMEENGITTLFMKKGGRVPFRGGGQDASQDDFGGSTSGGTGGDQGETSSDSGFDNTGPSNTNDNKGNETNREKGIREAAIEAARRSDLSRTIAEGPGSDIEKYDTPEQRQQGKYSGTTIGQIKKGQDIVNSALDKYNFEKDKFDKKYQNKVKQKIIKGVLGKGLSLGLTDIIGAVIDGMKVSGAKNDLLDSIQTEITNLQELGIPDFTPHTDTPIQTLTQLELDLTQKDRDEDDERDDGPPPIIEDIMAANQVIEERDETDIFDLWDRIKSNQSKRAMLVERGIIQDNEIMAANKGGLANLFRVKTQ